MPLRKNCKGTPIPGGECISKTWTFSSMCKYLGMQQPLRAKIWAFEKVNLGGYDSTSRSP